ncbi:hypothetical protein TNCV_4126711 [Trichonephila clavipes]|uniref:Uncharacterized protein n=1 Tax=Trichonephila clavipes TaxID=2585209 RepID=A0A8X6VRL8_TRICX|nr:hypothetical protein TNCV_4126711 [Trichonephila clavipes]
MGSERISPTHPKELSLGLDFWRSRGFLTCMVRKYNDSTSQVSLPSLDSILQMQILTIARFIISLKQFRGEQSNPAGAVDQGSIGFELLMGKPVGGESTGGGQFHVRLEDTRKYGVPPKKSNPKLNSSGTRPS